MEYPDDLNPFGDDDDSAIKTDFKQPQPPPRSCWKDSYDETLNPFGDDADADESPSQSGAISSSSAQLKPEPRRRRSRQRDDDDTQSCRSACSADMPPPLPIAQSLESQELRPAKRAAPTAPPRQNEKPPNGDSSRRSSLPDDNLPLPEIEMRLEALELRLQEVERGRQEAYTKAKEDQSSYHLAETQRLLREKADLFDARRQLQQLRQQRQLESEQSECEQELRRLMTQRTLTSADQTRQEQLLSKMMDLVERRDRLCDVPNSTDAAKPMVKIKHGGFKSATLRRIMPRKSK